MNEQVDIWTRNTFMNHGCFHFPETTDRHISSSFTMGTKEIIVSTTARLNSHINISYPMQRLRDSHVQK